MTQAPKSLSVAALFAEREARRRNEQEANERLQRRKEEELAAYKQRLEKRSCPRRHSKRWQPVGTMKRCETCSDVMSAGHARARSSSLLRATSTPDLGATPPRLITPRIQLTRIEATDSYVVQRTDDQYGPMV